MSIRARWNEEILKWLIEEMEIWNLSQEIADNLVAQSSVVVSSGPIAQGSRKQDL